MSAAGISAGLRKPGCTSFASARQHKTPATRPLNGIILVVLRLQVSLARGTSASNGLRRVLGAIHGHATVNSQTVLEPEKLGSQLGSTDTMACEEPENVPVCVQMPPLQQMVPLHPENPGLRVEMHPRSRTAEP